MTLPAAFGADTLTLLPRPAIIRLSHGNSPFDDSMEQVIVRVGPYGARALSTRTIQVPFDDDDFWASTGGAR